MSTGRPDFIWPPAGDDEAAANPAPANAQSSPPDPASSPIAEERLAHSHRRQGTRRRRSAAPLLITALAIVSMVEGAIIAVQYSRTTPEPVAAAPITITGTPAIARSLTPDGVAHADASPAVAATTTAPQAPAGAVHRRQGTVPRAAAPPEPRYGLLYLNALPWADVAIDGHPAGQTPLGRIQVAAGVHEVRFTHPQLGEQVREVVVDPNSATRIGVDLRQ